MRTKVRSKGAFLFECFNPDGSLAWRELVPNGVTTAGLNDMLQVAFNSGTQKTSWFLALINNAGYTAVALADTMASHSGWTELTDYNEATRPTWVAAAAAGGSISNSSTGNFTNTTANNQVRGAFLVSDNTKGGATGTLWATALLSTVRTLNAGQVLKISYTTTLAE